MRLWPVGRTPPGGRRRGVRRALIGALVVAVAAMGGLLPSGDPEALAAGGGFPDVPMTHSYYTAITDLAGRGIIGGYADGRFRPDDPVSRQQFAKMVVLTGGYPVSEADICPFGDVSRSGAGTLFPDNYVAACAARGITTGKTARLFDIGTCGSNSYEATAVGKELVEEYNESARWGHGRPDCIVRSHRHRHIEVRVPTNRGFAAAFTTPGWQLKTPFAWKIAGARLATPQFGGSLIRCGDEELYTRHRIWSIEPTKAERV